MGNGGREVGVPLIRFASSLAADAQTVSRSQVTTVLSSRWTLLFKFGFPIIWGGLWSYATALLFVDPSSVTWHGGGEPPPWAKWLFLAFLVLGAVTCARVCLPLKRVMLDDESLVVSNYFRSIRVPLR